MTQLRQVALALLLIAAAVCALLCARPGQDRRSGAGASAENRARQLRTPLVRLATALGIPTAAERLARRSEIGAAGERRTAERLDQLTSEGWTVLHDRALPTGNANLDHLAISPRGLVAVVDSKLWSARWPLQVRGGRLLHGKVDVTGRLRGIRHEADTVQRHLGVPVVRLVVVDGAPIPGGELVLDGMRIVPAERAVAVLRGLDRVAVGRQAAGLAARAERLFPPYQQRATRAGRRAA